MTHRSRHRRRQGAHFRLIQQIRLIASGATVKHRRRATPAPVVPRSDDAPTSGASQEAPGEGSAADATPERRAPIAAPAAPRRGLLPEGVTAVALVYQGPNWFTDECHPYSADSPTREMPAVRTAPPSEVKRVAANAVADSDTVSRRADDRMADFQGRWSARYAQAHQDASRLSDLVVNAGYAIAENPSTQAEVDALAHDIAMRAVHGHELAAAA